MILLFNTKVIIKRYSNIDSLSNIVICQIIKEEWYSDKVFAPIHFILSPTPIHCAFPTIDLIASWIMELYQSYSLAKVI